MKRLKNRASKAAASVETLLVPATGIAVLVILLGIAAVHLFTWYFDGSEASEGSMLHTINATVVTRATQIEGEISEKISQKWIKWNSLSSAELVGMLGTLLGGQAAVIYAGYKLLKGRQEFRDEGFKDSVNVSLCSVCYNKDGTVELKSRSIMTMPLEQMFIRPTAVEELVESAQKVQDRRSNPEVLPSSETINRHTQTNSAQAKSKPPDACQRRLVCGA
jgi:hypothetical protein